MTGALKPTSCKEVVMGYQFDTNADVIGKGAYGTVYRAKLVESCGRGGADLGELVALKKTLCSKKEEGIPASTLREVMVLRELSKTFRDGTAANSSGAENVVKLYDVIMERGVVYIVSELCDGGDLSNYLSSLPKRRLTDCRQYRQWMLDFLGGLSFLHRKGISHRDLKPQNLVLKKHAGANGTDTDALQYTIKLVDFGLSRLEEIPVKKYQHEVVTLWYRSPDVLLGNTNYSYTADMWSAGCIMAETATGSPLFYGKNNTEQIKCIFSRLGPPTEETFPSMRQYALYDEYVASLASLSKTNDHIHAGIEEVDVYTKAYNSLRHYFERYGVMEMLGRNGVDLLAHLLAYEPKHRFTVSEALQHPFFLIMTSPIVLKTRQESFHTGRGGLKTKSNSCPNSSEPIVHARDTKAEGDAMPHKEQQQRQDQQQCGAPFGSRGVDEDHHIDSVPRKTKEDSQAAKGRNRARTIGASSFNSVRIKKECPHQYLSAPNMSLRSGINSKTPGSSTTKKGNHYFHP